MSNILGLDIGGANIKAADGLGYARSWPFALWKSPDLLAAKLTSCLAEAPPHERIVVTMTGELCDCFETKREGVQHIVSASLEAAGATPIVFYQTTGQFVSADEAVDNHLLTAASNWHALATFALRYVGKESALLIDIGSTTTDIVPLFCGKEAHRGTNDSERLVYRELVYTGVVRSPVCAIVSQLPWRGTDCPVAQEFFATSGDAYLLLGDLPEDPTDTTTADGKAFTKPAAYVRLARMICGDLEIVSLDELQAFAVNIRDAQLKMIGSAFKRVIDSMRENPKEVILSGQGEFLARQLLERQQYTGKVISLTGQLGPEVSRCAPAHALAVLASEIL